MNIKSVSTIVLSAIMIVGCKQQAETTNVVPQEQAPVAVSGLKIAFVDIDSLLANYAFYQDLTEELIRKQENFRLSLAEDEKSLQKDIDDFNNKVRNNVYSSAERVQQEQNRLERKRQAYIEKGNKYAAELEDQNNANSQKVGEAIDKFVKEYNKKHGYNLIITRSSILYADDVMNITAQILDGLNAEYNSPNE